MFLSSVPTYWITIILALLSGPVEAQGISATISQWFARTQSMTSGLAIQTKQTATSSQQVSSVTHSSFKALADTFVKTNAAFDYTKNLQNNTSPLSSGGELCRVADIGVASNNAKDVTEIIRSGVSDYEKDWKANGGDQNDVLLTQLEMRQQVYCSEAEFQAGLCSEHPSTSATTSAAGFPAGDTNAAPFMLTRSYGSTEAANGLNYIDSLAPLPTIRPVSRGVGDDISKLIAVQEMAWVSAARGSVADVVARGTEGGN